MMTTDDSRSAFHTRRDVKIKRRFIWSTGVLVSICVALLLAIPRSTEVAPRLAFVIVSPSGNPVPQACVRESWQNYNLHEPLHSEEVVADSSGRVVFAVRAMRSSRLRELLGMMQNIVHNPVHSGHGNETLVMAWAPGMEGERGGPGMVLRPEMSRLALVPPATTQPPCRPGTAP
jgi:hypothetical protein